MDPVNGHKVNQPFQTERVAVVSLGHALHDTFSAFVAPLLPLLQERLGTNYAQTGSLAIYAQLPNLFNPLIGYIADKVSLRYFIIFAPAITATLMSLLGLTSGYFQTALLLTAAGFSVAAFHAPAPALIANVAGNRVGRGMSIFMAAGELGRTVGPVLVAWGVARYGLDGLWRMAFIGWAVTIILFWRLYDIPAQPAATSGLREALPTLQRLFPALLFMMFARVFLVAAVTTYLPLYMENELGSSFRLAALSLTILEAASVVGALSSGTLSDLIGRSRILLALFIAAPIVAILFLFAPVIFTIPLLLLLGLTAIPHTPVFLAIVQDFLPTNRALGNGLFLASNFVSRAFAIYVVGVLADNFGLTNAFLVSAIIGVACIPALRFLPELTNTN
jgi:FSR family fosmidomycin resistance protein-like MFS transporter